MFQVQIINPEVYPGVYHAGEFLNSETVQLDLTKVGSLFQIKDPWKCTEFLS